MITVAFFMIACSSNNRVYAQNTSWEKLGTKKVDYKLDRDVIKVGARDGAFTKLKIGVTNGALNMHKMVVVYKNGQRDEISIRQNFTKKSDSRIIDLKGNKRIINEVIFWYDTKNKSDRRAKIHVFGKH